MAGTKAISMSKAELTEWYGQLRTAKIKLSILMVEHNDIITEFGPVPKYLTSYMYRQHFYNIERTMNEIRMKLQTKNYYG